MSNFHKQGSGEESVGFGKLSCEAGMKGAIMQCEFPDQPGNISPADEERFIRNRRPMFQSGGSAVDFQRRLEDFTKKGKRHRFEGMTVNFADDCEPSGFEDAAYFRGGGGDFGDVHEHSEAENGVETVSSIRKVEQVPLVQGDFPGHAGVTNI